MEKASSSNIKVNLLLLAFEEDGIHYVHSPELELTGYGYNEEEADNSFTLQLEEFFGYATQHKTLQPELERMGWSMRGRTLSPPNFTDLIARNADLSDWLTKRPLLRAQVIRIPLFA